MSSSVSREREFAHLRCELRGKSYQELLVAAQADVPGLRRCCTWDEAAELILASGTHNPARDGSCGSPSLRINAMPIPDG